MMLHPSNRPSQPNRFTANCSLRVAMLGTLLLPALGVHAQPADPPTAREKARQRMEQRQAEIMAQMREAEAKRPPEVQSRSLSADGTRAASFSGDGTVTVWETGGGKEIRSIKAYDGDKRLGPFSTATLSRDGQLLFTLGTVTAQVAPGGVAQISNNGVTQTTQGKVWEVKTGKMLWTVPEMDDGVKWSTAVNTGVFSPDGKLLATKARYAPIHLWETATGKLVRTLDVPFINMDALTFSPDGKTLAGGGSRSSSNALEVLLWDVESGELQRSFKPAGDESGQIKCIAFSPNGKLLAAGGGVGKYEKITDISSWVNIQYGMAQLWDVKSGVLLSDVGRPIHRSLVTTLAFSPDGTRLATGSIDQTVGLWDTHTRASLGDVACYAPETGAVVTAVNDNGVKAAGSGVRDLAFSTDGKTLNILNDQKQVRVWDVSTSTPQSDPLRKFLPGSQSRYSTLAFTPNSHALVTGEAAKRVRFWTVGDREETDSFIAHNDAIVKVALAPRGLDEPRYPERSPLLATGSNVLQWKKTGENSASGQATGLEVKLWDSQSHELQRTLALPGYSLTALTFAPGGRWVAAVGGALGPLPTNAFAVNGGFGVAAGGPINAANPADGVQKKTGVVVVWDTATGEMKYQIPIMGSIPSDLKFSPNGEILACDNNEAGVALWSTVNGQALRVLDDQRPPVLKPGERRVSMQIGIDGGKPTLAFTSDGTVLARSWKGGVKFWNVATGTLQSTINEAKPTPFPNDTYLALTPDSQTLALADPTQGLTLWSVATGKQLWKSPEKSRISMLEMAPNGKTLATSDGNTIRLWDISKAEQGVVG